MSETPESVRATLEKAFDAGEVQERGERTPPPPRVEQRPETGHTIAPEGARPERSAPAASTEAEPEAAPPAGDRVRDQFGRFTRATPEGPKPEAQQAPTAEPVSPSADLPETKAAEPVPTPAIQPPVSWSAVAKSEWDNLPLAVQAEVQRREQDVSRGFEQRAQQIRDFEPIAQVIAPHAQKFALRGVHPAAAVQQLLAVQDMLERDPVEGVAYVARSYGVDLRQFAAAFDQAAKSQTPQDPAVRQLSDQMAQMQGYLRNQVQAVQTHELSRIQQEIQAFEADAAAHPHFAAVRPAMAQLMQQGLSQTLQEAYDHACWAIPEIRNRLLNERRQTEVTQRSKAEKEAADRARRAGVSVSGAPTSGNGAVRKPERTTVRSAVEAAFEELASR